MPPEPALLADDDAVFLIGVNVARINQALVDLGLSALGAFALWLPNEDQHMEPAAVSVCSAASWRARLEPLRVAPDAAGVALALDPQTWDHPELDLGEPDDPARFDAASARLYERFGDDDRDPAAQVLDETARLVARTPPVPADLLVAMTTDGSSRSDELLASIRYASPSSSVEALEAAGLPQSYWELP